MNWGYIYEVLGDDARDKYLIELFEKLDLYSSGSEVDKIFSSLSTTPGKLEKRDWVNYRYGEYSFISMFENFGKAYVESLEIVNNLNLSIFPKLILPKRYEDGCMYIVVKIPGNVGEDIKWGQCLTEVYNLSETAKQQAVSDLIKLEDAGYLLLPKFRFSVGVTPDGHVMIPDVPLIKKEDAQKFLSDIYARYSMFGWHKKGL